MRALWTASYPFYPLRSGGQFSVYPWLRGLSRRGWEFSLVKYNSPPSLSDESLKELS